MTILRYQVLILGTLNLPLFGKRAFADITKDFKRRELLSFMQMGPKCHHTFPSERKREKERTQTPRRESDRTAAQTERQAVSQGMPTAARTWKREEMDSILKPPEAVLPC